MDLSAISSAASGFKVAIDLAKGINALNTSTEVRQKTSELLDAVVNARFQLLEASDTQAALLERVKHLEQHIAGLEDWDREKERYQLKAIDTGAFAYMHKPGMENGEPAIWLCQTCFQKRQTSPLQYRDQPNRPTGGRGMHCKWGCNSCKVEVMVYYAREPSVPWDPKDGQ